MPSLTYADLVKFLRDLPVPPSSRSSLEFGAAQAKVLKLGERFRSALGNPEMNSNLKAAFDRPRPLKYFPPCQVIYVVLGDPEQDVGVDYAIVPVVLDPAAGAFKLATLQWINTYRVQHPLKPRDLSETDLQDYLYDLCSMAAFDYHMPSRKIKRGPTVRTQGNSCICTYHYEEWAGSAGKDTGKAEVVFDQNGGLLADSPANAFLLKAEEQGPSPF